MYGKIEFIDNGDYKTKHTLVVNGGKAEVDGKPLPNDSPAWKLVYDALHTVESVAGAWSNVTSG